MLFKKALKDINDLLKHEAVDNNNLLTGHRINHKTDLEKFMMDFKSYSNN